MDDISSQHTFFSEDPETLGFDLSAGNVWIYPENYPTRDYQFAIVKNALFRNTLVCLPTGLGKTFIAAVLMYNFWRWYPKGKVVFLAPTKPLVAQQIHACHEIMGIPSEETIELTGTTNQKLREIAWTNKRVIFATPQTFHKDLEKNIFPLNMVKCLVIDEAHKALGKHSYCESVRLLSEQNKYFRVLALSATPGDKISKVVEVITNLHISNLELRDDMSPDITPYINERKFDIILVRLSDELARFKERYISVMDPHVRFLVRFNILKGDTGNISKGRIFHLVKEFQSRQNKNGNYGQVMKTLNILLTMYHAYDLMIRHGLRAFMHFYENHNDKSWLVQEINLHEMLEDIKNYLGPFPIIEPLSDGTIPDVPNDVLFGHNKFYKLKEVLEKHFKSFRARNEETRAIVFVEYRDIVNEVHVLLLQSRPLIRPQMFVGQAGQKRRQQIEALENFRSNKVNVLISTSVGEEGLDVGEVDLIVCFDISQNSPIRLVQRMGRTGRKRDGRIIALVTDGKEHESLKMTMSKKDSLNSKVLQSSAINTALYEQSPRMIPNQFTPDCRKMHMKVLTKTPKVKGAMKRKEIQKTKKKTTELRLIEKEPGAKNTGQSSIQNFFKTTKPGERMADYTNYGCSQVQQNISIKDVNLYFSDKESEEFLTLCAMRKTRTDTHVLNFEINEKYYPLNKSNPSRDLNFLRNLIIPNLNDKDYVKSIPEVIENTEETMNHEVANSQIQENFPLPCFDNNISHFYDTFFETSEVTIERSFVDLIYDSSSSEELENIQNDNLPNQLEVTCNFDDLLETTDESDVEVEMEMQMELGDLKMEIKTESNKMDIDTIMIRVENRNLCNEISSNVKSPKVEEREGMFNFTDILEDSSLDSINQDFSNIVALNPENSNKNSINKEIINEQILNEKDLLGQQNTKNSHNLRNEGEMSSNAKNVLSESIKMRDLIKAQNSKISGEILSVPEKTQIYLNATCSVNENHSAQDKSETAINVSHILGGMTLDCLNSQDLSHPEILSNEENPSRQENLCRDNSIFTLSSNASGITITQAIEEIEKINANKSNNNNSLFKEKNTPPSEIINSSPITKTAETNIPNVPKDKQIVYEILDSDDELFNNEFDDISIIASNVPEPVQTQIENIAEGKTITFGNLEITKVNKEKKDLNKFSIDEKKNSSTTTESLSKEIVNEKGKSNISEGEKITITRLEIKAVNPNKLIPNEEKNSSTSFSNERGNSNKATSANDKEITELINEKEIFPSDNKAENSKSINEKENSHLSFDITDDGWDSDFEIQISEVKSTNYFKENENKKSEDTPITKISHEVTNTEHQNIPKPIKKFSLFKRDKPLSLLEEAEKNQTTNNIMKQQINNEEIFKKPDLNTLRRINFNSPSTSNGRINRNNDLSTRIANKRELNREISFNSTLIESPKMKRRRKITKRKHNCEFIDNEADVSYDDEYNTSEGSSGDDDEDLEDFVSYTQNNTEQVDMRAHYLKSVRSPIRRPGAFLIKKSSHFHENIFSQPASQFDDTYQQDSFCVDEEEIEYNEGDSDDDDLEIIAENLTEITQNRAKRKREKSPIFKCNKRKKGKGRIQNLYNNNSSSSDDETEQMRKQIQNESILLKKCTN